MFNTICRTSFIHIEFIPRDILPYAIKEGNLQLFFFLYGFEFHLDDIDHQEAVHGGRSYFYFTIPETNDSRTKNLNDITQSSF